MTWIKSNFKIFPFICAVLTTAVVFTLMFSMDRINNERNLSHYYLMFTNREVFTFADDHEAGEISFEQGDQVTLKWASYADGVTVQLEDGTPVEGVPIGCFVEKDRIADAIDSYERYRTESEQKLEEAKTKDLLKSAGYSAFTFVILTFLCFVITDKKAASVTMAAVLVLAVFGALWIVTSLR